MRNKTDLTIVYIPGLFDRVRFVQFLQSKALQPWRMLGVRVIIYTMGWSLDARFEDRLDELENLIRNRTQQGERVAVVGASAGASAAVTLLEKCPELVTSATLICGKIHRPDMIPGPVLEYNTVFEQALDQLDERLDNLDPSQRARILSLRAAHDGIVPPQDTIIEGADNRQMPVIGHLTGIAFALMNYGVPIVRFARRHVTLERDDTTHG